MREVRLDHNSAAIAAGNLEFVRLDLLEQPERLDILDYFLARLEAVESAIRFRCLIVDARLFSQYVDDLEIVAFAYLIVIEIMRWRDFYTAGTKLRINIVIGNNGYPAATQRQVDKFPDQMRIARIFWMDSHSAVAQECLGARSGDNQMLVALRDGVAEMPH